MIKVVVDNFKIQQVENEMKRLLLVTEFPLLTLLLDLGGQIVPTTKFFIASLIRYEAFNIPHLALDLITPINAHYNLASKKQAEKLKSHDGMFYGVCD